jgi:hypothetical protein
MALVTGIMANAAFAFSPNAALSALPSNTAQDLGLYTTHCADSTGDPDNCRRYGDYSRFTYDPEHHQILFFGGGHATTMRDDIDVFNFQDLSWKSAYKSTACSEMTSITTEGTWSNTSHPVARHTYDQLIYAPNVHGLFITSPVYGAGYCGTYGGCGEWCAGKMFLYNPETKAWTAKTTATNSAHVWSSEYDPLSGTIVSVGGGGLNVYDPIADSKTEPLSSSTISGYADNLVYYPPIDKFYYMARGNPVMVYEVTLNRTTWNLSTIIEVTGMTGTPQTAETGWAYDTANKIIGGGVAKGVFYAYDPIQKTWDSASMQVQTGSASGITCYSHCLDYDPVNRVFIMLGTDFHTWAYCYSRTSASAATKRIIAEPFRIISASCAGHHDIRIRFGTPVDISSLRVSLFNAAGVSLPVYTHARGGDLIVHSASNLLSGIYLIRVKLSGQVFTHKLIVQG